MPPLFPYNNDKRVAQKRTNCFQVLPTLLWSKVAFVIFSLKVEKWENCSKCITSTAANILLDEDVFKTSWLRQMHLHWSHVFKMLCKDVFKTASRSLEDVSLKLSLVLLTRLQDLLYTLQNIFKTSSRRL